VTNLRPVPPPVVHRIPRVSVAAVLVIAAEAGHLLSALDEWPEWLVRGIFHTGVAALQGLLLASLVVGAGATAIRRGAMLNLLLALLWLISRTAGVPSIVTLHRLSVGPVDTITALAELAVAGLLYTEWRRLEEARRAPQLPGRTLARVERVGDQDVLGEPAGEGAQR
jgi:hypothetical protein